MMRAIQISSYGDPQLVAKLVDLPEPNPPQPGEVLLEMEFAPVNPADLLLLRGLMPVRPSLPTVVGNEGVGTILAVGSDVFNVEVGDRVVPPLYSFTWRERMITPAAGLFALPPHADVQQLAMLRVNPPTAALLLSEYVTLAPGDWIIQNAANSGVGRSVTAFAKARGIRTINLVRRPELVPELKDLGGDIILVDGPDVGEAIAAAVKDGHVRLALDGISGDATGRLASHLSPGGTLVGYALMSGDLLAKVHMLDLMWKDLSLRGFSLGHAKYDDKIYGVLVEAAGLIALGELRVPVAAVYPLSKIQEAIAHVERGGKVLLDVAS